ncbi:hypothetical protein [Marinospirillum perlucidum]|uniref:hypothetical protein n=1 Tax=Marinospirillum perlucidum TaxID=1982602 RepID=UPI000DF3C50A|nr:hypothetical protein [Marinospirillum perlucidum]
MGMLLLPLLLFWLGAAGYSLFAGYSLLASDYSLGLVLLLAGVALLLALVYAWLGLSSFKGQDEIWAFAPTFYFLANKWAFLFFILATLVRVWPPTFLQFAPLSALCFVIALAVSAGTLAGFFSADAYLKKHEIRLTY